MPVPKNKQYPFVIRLSGGDEMKFETYAEAKPYFEAAEKLLEARAVATTKRGRPAKANSAINKVKRPRTKK